MRRREIGSQNFCKAKYSGRNTKESHDKLTSGSSIREKRKREKRKKETDSFSDWLLPLLSLSGRGPLIGVACLFLKIKINSYDIKIKIT